PSLFTIRSRLGEAMLSCPVCGRDRLKSAPLPLMSVFVAVVTQKRRYECTSCSWAGWRHRLRRRQRSSHVSLAERQLPGRRAIAFFLIVLAILAGTIVLLLKSFEASEPTPIEGVKPVGRMQDRGATSRAQA